MGERRSWHWGSVREDADGTVDHGNITELSSRPHPPAGRNRWLRPRRESLVNAPLLGRRRPAPAERRRHRRTDPAATRGCKRALAAGAAILAPLGMSVALAPSASAALSTFGPENPQTLFPDYYTDSSGLSLQLCQDGPALCLAGPESIEQVHASGADA